MKRYVAIMLAVCLLFCITACKHKEETTQPENNAPAVRYFFGVGSVENWQQVHIVQSREQIEEIASAVIGDTKEVKLRHPEFVNPDRVESGPGKPFIEYCQQYTDSFFEDKYLVIVRCTAQYFPEYLEAQKLIFTPSGQLRIFLNTVLDKDCVGENGSYAQNDASISWGIVYEIDRSNGVVTSDQVSVVIDTSINMLEDVVDLSVPASTP